MLFTCGFCHTCVENVLNESDSIYNSSKDLLMFTPCNRCRCFPENILKNLKLHSFRKPLDNYFFEIGCLWYKMCNRLHTIFNKVQFQYCDFPCIFYVSLFVLFLYFYQIRKDISFIFRPVTSLVSTRMDVF